MSDTRDSGSETDTPKDHNARCARVVVFRCCASERWIRALYGRSFDFGTIFVDSRRHLGKRKHWSTEGDLKHEMVPRVGNFLFQVKLSKLVKGTMKSHGMCI